MIIPQGLRGFAVCGKLTISPKSNEGLRKNFNCLFYLKIYFIDASGGGHGQGD